MKLPLLVLALVACTTTAWAGQPCHNCPPGHRHGHGHRGHGVFGHGGGAQQTPITHSASGNPTHPNTWHGSYYHTAYGAPLALVVPPTAAYERNFGWGVNNTRVSKINSQFARPFPGYGYNGAFLPTPLWPSDTEQFGVYYVRGPW